MTSKFELLLTNDGQEPLTDRGRLVLQATKLVFESRLSVLSTKRMSIMNRITKLEDLSPYNTGEAQFDLENWDNKRIKLQVDFDKVMDELTHVDALYTEYFLVEPTTTTSTTEEPLTTTSSTTTGEPTTTTTTSEVPVVTIFTILNGEKEVPPVITSALGDATLVFNEDTKVFKITVTYADIEITGAHIHKGDVGVDGPIIFPLDYTMNPIVYTSAPLTEEQESDLSTGQYYVNIHSVQYPDGEIRGQLIP